MTLILGHETTPTTPSAGKSLAFIDSADKGLKVRDPDGSVAALIQPAARNLLINGAFLFAQRQTPGTLTTYSDTAGRAYGLDRWGITNENASAQVRRVDTATAFETGIGARHYAEAKKITSTGKLVLSQVVEGMNVMALRGRKVRVQFKAKNSVGSHTLRCALLYLSTAGTIDTIPATFVSAFGAASTDPTWGTNLAAIVPSSVNANSALTGAGVSAVLTSAWRNYGGVFTVPTTALNLVVVIFTNGQMTAGDIFHLSEVGLFDGEEERPALLADYGEELRRCMRHYWKSFDIDVAPVQNIGSITGAIRQTAHGSSTTVNRSPSFLHPVVMRATPTPTAYSPLAASAQAYDSTASAVCTSTAAQTVTDRGWAYVTTGHSTTVVGNQLSVHVTMEAEL